MTDEELLYLLALQKAPKIGDITAKKLLNHCKTAKNIYREKKQNLLKIDGIGQYILEGLDESKNIKRAKKELRYIQENDIQFWHYQSPDYPDKLKYCIDSPLLLFYEGTFDLCKKKIISIVGTRQATNYGLHFCNEVIETLSIFDPIIVSGFAYGIDIEAHKAALDNNLETIACLAHGLNQVYPKAHKKYWKPMTKKGGFLTDFWSDDVFDRNNFLKRNRLIAGLSEATIVIESAEKGGSLVTADIANSYNREVFAVPGRVKDSQSQGCLNLIKRNEAHILTDPADIVFHLNWQVEEIKERVIQKKLFIELDETEKRIYKFLNTNGKELLDIISLNCDLPIFKTSSALLSMELKGLIRPLPGKLFEAI